MPPIHQLVTSTVTRMLFRSAVVSKAIPLSGHFRLIEIEGDRLKDVPWTPGQKIQIHLGNLVCRTYTPIDWDPIQGRMRFVAFLHGYGPGSDWAASLATGEACQFLGPRSSLDFAQPKKETIFFGDETSIGAAVAHQRGSQDATQNTYVFEVSSLPEAQEVIRRLELQQAKLIVKAPGRKHLSEVEQEIAAAVRIAPRSQWIFTGNAQSIQSIRKSLRHRHRTSGQISTKAYWAYGKKGLD